MTALPAVKAGGDSYSYTWFEQAWIPAGAEHQDAAKQIVAYLYSDEACKLLAESGAIQPVLGIADSLEGDNKIFYSIYDNGGVVRGNAPAPAGPVRRPRPRGTVPKRRRGNSRSISPSSLVCSKKIRLITA